MKSTAVSSEQTLVVSAEKFAFDAKTSSSSLLSLSSVLMLVIPGGNETVTGAGGATKVAGGADGAGGAGEAVSISISGVTGARTTGVVVAVGAVSGTGTSEIGVAGEAVVRANPPPAIVEIVEIVDIVEIGGAKHT